MPEAAAIATPENTELETRPVDEISSATEPALVEDDLLVEDVSIDGMCGVY